MNKGMIFIGGYFLLWNISVKNATKLKKAKFAVAKTFQTRNSLFNPDGSMAKRQSQTPKAQIRLMSLDERLFIIFIISGILHSGNVIEAIRAIVSIII
ncbi:MAG: hypothetical protein KKH08_05110 [Candidatus Omnitrophica bacterium]|nr:hypothetical protein [Candidatus Omnitrophota bacterium]